MKMRLAVWGAVFAAFFLVVGPAAAGRQTVDTKVTVVSDTWTVANSLATNLALLSTTTMATPAGVAVTHGGGLGVCVSAESTRTITSGTLRAYVYMPVSDSTTPPTYRWVPYAAGDWTLTGGNRDECKGDLSSLSGIGRYAYVEDNIAVSAGTTVVVTYSMRTGLPQ